MTTGNLRFIIPSKFVRQFPIDHQTGNICYAAVESYFMLVNYTLKRSKKRKKTISIQIVNSSEVAVYAPYYAPLCEINRFVKKKQHWISKTLQKKSEITAQDKQFVKGELFYFLGRPYSLEVAFEPLENTKVALRNNRLHLNATENKGEIKHCLYIWYKKKALEFIGERLNYFRGKLGLPPCRLRITSARTRWGSCSHTNNLAFSFRLIMAPPQVIDYVVIHELMHLRQKNHSSSFWKLVAEVIPQYKRHRLWLKDNQLLFNF